MGRPGPGVAHAARHRLEERFLLGAHRLEPGHGGHRVDRGHVLHHLRLPLLEHLETHGQEIGHDGLRLRRIGAHQVSQHADRQNVLPPAFVFGDDLQKVLPGQVVAGFQIDDLHLAPVADEPGDIVERHVVGCLGVVEPSAGIPLDQERPVGGSVGAFPVAIGPPFPAVQHVAAYALVTKKQSGSAAQSCRRIGGQTRRAGH
jgi:hypothetical protein